MKLNPSVIKARMQLEGALVKEDTDELARIQQRLIDLLITATVKGDDASIREIRAMNIQARNEMVWRFKTGIDEGPDALAWMFEAGTRVASAAARLRPAKTQPREADMSVRDRVLRALAKSNRPLSNADLVIACRTTAETISRVLGALRSQGLVVSRKAGARSINDLTPKGRLASINSAARLEASEKNPAETTKISAESLLNLEPEPSASGVENDHVRLPAAELSKKNRSNIIELGADRASFLSKSPRLNYAE